MATHSSILAWKIPWTAELGRLQSVHGVVKSRTQLSDFTFFLVIVWWWGEKSRDGYSGATSDFILHLAEKASLKLEAMRQIFKEKET